MSQQQDKKNKIIAEAIKVIPKRAGFRRAGYAFPEEGLTIRLSELNDKQLDQLENEPMLVVMRMEVEAPSTVDDKTDEAPQTTEKPPGE